MRGRVLIVAGSDSGGGAGIQADIKTVTMLDGYAATAVTALTVQNTEGVFGVMPVPPDFIRRQIEVVLDDIGADAVKTGMLHDAAVIETVAAVLEERAAAVPLVVDPVMAAKGGARLIEADAVEALKAAAHRARDGADPEPPRGRDPVRRRDRQCRRDAARRRGFAKARLRRGAGQGRASRRGHRDRRARDRDPGFASGKARGSTPATPTAPAAPSLRQSPPGWRRASTPKPRSIVPAPMSSARSRRRPASAAATARSTTPTRCGHKRVWIRAYLVEGTRHSTPFLPSRRVVGSHPSDAIH